ncbi:PQQ-dependent dehydrogenase, methanol/ethanol family, partial [Gammaproteobacteria bacterium]|nr:PQQ-dependent dehydrogenase, methanol/ethanol family [Gammaproteobacteria bacterium]
MRMYKFMVLCGLVCALGIGGCSDGPATSASQSAAGSGSDIGQIDDARINNAASEPGNWLAYGRDYEEQRFSPLKQINRETVDRLGLAFELDLGSNDALESTPIVVDNTMFFTSTFAVVHAVDAKTGVE